MLIFALTVSALGQNISGNLSGTLGPGTYNVVGDCQVLSGQTLLIQAGTIFLHTGNFTWTINGNITANGTELSPIQFRPQITGNTWGGIRFNPGPSTGNFQWCIIDHCYNSANGGGFYIGNGGITLSHCQITYCQSTSGGGIYAYNGTANLIIDDCYIAHNTAGNGGGMYFSGCNGSIVRNSEIAYNSSTNT
jgi:hypothetical protein